MKTHVEKILCVSESEKKLIPSLGISRSCGGPSEFFVSSVTTEMSPYADKFYFMNGKDQKVSIASKDPAADVVDTKLLNFKQYHLYHLGDLLSQAIRTVYPKKEGISDYEYIESLDEKVDNEGIFQIQKIFFEKMQHGTNQEIETTPPFKYGIYTPNNIHDSKSSSSSRINIKTFFFVATAATTVVAAAAAATVATAKLRAFFLSGFKTNT